MSRPARITIHSKAIKHNLLVAKRFAPDTKVMPALKADAYRHGMIQTAETLHDSADGFLVACLSEALRLRDAQISLPIMVIQGHQCLDDLIVAAEKDIRLVIHDQAQLPSLDQLPASAQVKITLKLDTGMHRLGLSPELAISLYNKLQKHPNVHSEIWLMSHLACADDLDNDHASQQINCFNQYTQALSAPKTIANSAGILGWVDSHYDWIRPGIMMYGSSPFADKLYAELGLEATMTLTAPLIAKHPLKKGDAIGYGSTWTCPKDMLVGVIACGYADGYPRHIAQDTPIWMNGRKTRILGRVSMDLIVIELTDLPAEIGQLAECWGEHIAVDEIAISAETISYELLCHAGSSTPTT
jgi:alanine racemase